jgi:hypothetical protein
MVRNFSLFRTLATATLLCTGAHASEFTFFTTLRAGFQTPDVWEIGIGSTAATTNSRVNFRWANNANHWRPSNQPQNFQIGYNQATNSAFVTVFNSNNAPITATFANPGPSLLPTATWTIPSTSFFASATPNSGAASVTVANLAFSNGVTVLSGALPSGIGASSPGNTSNSLSAPIVFTPAAAGGSWMITGTIRFSGLFPFGSATDNTLRFGFGAGASDVPEVSSSLMIGAGLLGLGLFFQRRKRTPASPVKP